MIDEQFMIAHGMLPKRDCAACFFKCINNVKPDGWCYMFKDEPQSDYCGQFKLDPSLPAARSDAASESAK